MSNPGAQRHEFKINPKVAIIVAVVSFAGAYVGRGETDDRLERAKFFQERDEKACLEATKAYMSAPRDSMDYLKERHLASLDQKVRTTCGFYCLSSA